MAKSKHLQTLGAWASHNVTALYPIAHAALVGLVLLMPSPIPARADIIIIPSTLKGISALRLFPYLEYRGYASEGRSDAEPCRTSLEALLTVDCFRSEYDMSVHDEQLNITETLGHHPVFTKLDVSFEVAPKARKIDLSPFELQAILAAYPVFQLRYGQLNGRRIKVSDSEDYVGVDFYDPNPSTGCRGNCGRGSMRVILKKPGLHYVGSILPR